MHCPESVPLMTAIDEGAADQVSANVSVPSTIAVSLPIELGTSASGAPVFLDIAAGHTAIIGLSGAGKTNALASLVCQLLALPPHEVQLVIADGKQGVDFCDFEPERRPPHLARPVIVDPDDLLAAFDELLKLVASRFRIFRGQRARSLAEFRAQGGIMPAVVVVIDELPAFLAAGPRPELEQALVQLAQLGRAAGVFLVVSAQRTTTDIVASSVLANISNRVCCRTSRRLDSRTAIGCGGAELLPIGEFLGVLSNSYEVVRGRVPLVKRQSVLAAISAARERFGEPSDWLLASATQRTPPIRCMTAPQRVACRRGALGWHWRSRSGQLLKSLAKLFSPIFRFCQMCLSAADWGLASLVLYFRKRR